MSTERSPSGRATQALWVLIGFVAVVGGWALVRSVDGPAGAVPADSIAGQRLTGVDGGPGTCLDWVDEPDGAVPAHEPTTATVVPCARSHRLEVLRTVEGPDATGADGAADRARALVAPDAACRQALVELLGGRWDAQGALQPVAVVPDDDAWGAGDRDATCAVRRVDPRRPSALVRWEGRAVDQRQDLVVPAGTCLSGADLAEVVACDGTHDAWSVGPVELGQRPDGDDGWAQAALSGPCRAAADHALGRSVAAVDLFGRPVFTGAPIRPVLVPISEPSWAAGTRTTTCLLVHDRR